MSGDQALCRLFALFLTVLYAEPASPLRAGSALDKELVFLFDTKLDCTWAGATRPNGALNHGLLSL
jgi:hypothetical protein